MEKFLSYEKACKESMTFSDVVKWYHGDINELEVAKWIKIAEIDCVSKRLDPNPENTVNAMGYTQNMYR